jgi:hypothetical protein
LKLSGLKLNMAYAILKQSSLSVVVFGKMAILFYTK